MLTFHRTVDPRAEQLFINCGLGQDTAAMVDAYFEGLYPAELYKLPVHFVFSDPGDEHDLTYTWTEDYFIPYLKQRGHQLQWLKPASPDGSYTGSPYHRTAPTKDRKLKNGTIVKGYPNGRQLKDIISQYMSDTHPSFPMLGSGGRCTDTHKQGVLNRYRAAMTLAHWGRPQSDLPKFGKKNIVVVGIAADETSRLMPATADHYEIHYPLVELGWDRAKCQEVILASGLPLPPKSGCNCCPFAPPFHYWLLKHRWPERFERIVEMEARCIQDRIDHPYTARGEKRPIVYILDQFKAPISEAVEIWHAQPKWEALTLDQAQEMLYKTGYAVTWKKTKDTPTQTHACKYMDWGGAELFAPDSAKAC